MHLPKPLLYPLRSGSANKRHAVCNTHIPIKSSMLPHFKIEVRPILVPELASLLLAYSHTLGVTINPEQPTFCYILHVCLQHRSRKGHEQKCQKRTVQGQRAMQNDKSDRIATCRAPQSARRRAERRLSIRIMGRVDTENYTVNYPGKHSQYHQNPTTCQSLHSSALHSAYGRPRQCSLRRKGRTRCACN
jgi:hypothetical protein